MKGFNYLGEAHSFLLTTKVLMIDMQTCTRCLIRKIDLEEDKNERGGGSQFTLQLSSTNQAFIPYCIASVALQKVSLTLGESIVYIELMNYKGVH